MCLWALLHGGAGYRLVGREGVLSCAGSTGQSVKETAVSSIERIPVSREVLETMRDTVRATAEMVEYMVIALEDEAPKGLWQLGSKLDDIVIALEALCRPQS